MKLFQHTTLNIQCYMYSRNIHTKMHYSILQKIIVTCLKGIISLVLQFQSLASKGRCLTNKCIELELHQCFLQWNTQQVCKREDQLFCNIISSQSATCLLLFSWTEQLGTPFLFCWTIFPKRILEQIYMKIMPEMKEHLKANKGIIWQVTFFFFFSWLCHSVSGQTHYSIVEEMKKDSVIRNIAEEYI